MTRAPTAPERGAVRPARARFEASVALCVISLAAALAASLVFGARPVSIERALFDPASLDRTIVLSLRLPRALLATLAGAGLAAVGATYQAVLRNPLAEPFVLGVSGGAALGATCAIALGIPALAGLGAALLPASAFAGGVIATLLVYSVARAARDALADGGAGQPTQASATVLLAGVMINAIAASLITFLKALAPPGRAAQLLRWLTGFLDLPTNASLAAMALYVGAGCTVLLADAGRCNLLALGEEQAASLGVDVHRLERRLFLACSAVVGGIVSLTGLIGFVGLVVPHAVRRFVGADHKRVLPLSMLAGGATLLACDLASRVAFQALGTEPPVGAVTALLGGPVFLWILARGGAR